MRKKSIIVRIFKLNKLSALMGMINMDSLVDMNHVKAVDLMYTPLP